MALQSLEGHESGRQATDFDENFDENFGECENRNPEADSGFPGIKDLTFRLLAKAFAPNFPSVPVCENCWGDFYARIAQGVLSSSPLPAILLKNNKRIISQDKTKQDNIVHYNITQYKVMYHNMI